MQKLEKSELFEKIPARKVAFGSSIAKRASGNLLHPYANLCKQSSHPTAGQEDGAWLWGTGSGHEVPEMRLLLM